VRAVVSPPALSQEPPVARSSDVASVCAVPAEDMGSRFRVVAAEASAFDVLFRQQFDERYASLFRYLDRLCGDAALAADIAQESLVRLYERGRMPDDVRAWLVTVAHNRLRSTRRRDRRRAFLLALRAVIAPPAPPKPADSGLETDGRAATVRAALGTLAPREQEMLLLRSEGYSYREIATVVRIRDTSVGTLLRRAKAQFIRALGESADARD
jgi:RNA polymerase sigma-70 factor, ECF subfamily